ncbi:MAG: hypothetical protein AB7E81_18675 [Hyphomicrobiaceae bacterium]
MRWDVFFSGWGWAFAELAKPGVLKSLALLGVGTVVVLFVLSRIIRGLMNHHLADAVNHVLDKYDRRYRFHGIPRRPLLLIAECTAWVFGLKLLTELAQPFVVELLSPEMSEHIFGVARYDWLVLVAMWFLIVLFWIRFHRQVRSHDATKEDPTGRRKRWRTIPLFGRPTLALLLLMFLPDLCRFAATVGAEWTKSSLPEFATAQAAATSPMLERNYASGLRVTVTLEPKERVAEGVGR